MGVRGGRVPGFCYVGFDITLLYLYTVNGSQNRSLWMSVFRFSV